MPALSPKTLAILDALHLRVPLRTVVFGTMDFFRKLLIPIIRYRINRLMEQKRKVLRGNARPIRVCFVCIEKAQWGMQSVYDAMSRSSAFEPYVLACPNWIRHGEADPLGDLVAFFRQRGMRVETELLLGEELPDVMFVPMFSWYKLGGGVDYRRLYDKVLIVCVLYSWVTSDSDRYYHGNFEQVYLWRRFLFNDYEMAASRQYSPVGCRHAVSLGFPRNDEFLAARPDYSFWKGKTTKKIIWAPHWSVLTHGHLGNFDRYAYKLLSWLRNRPEVEIVLKPHPLLRARLTDPDTIKNLRANNDNFQDPDSFKTAQEYDDFIDAWKNLPNGNVMNSGDYSGLFASSDAMLLDSGSFTVEYMIYNKPLCFCNRDRTPEELSKFFNGLGRDVLQGMDVASDWDEVVKFLDDVACGRDWLKKEREYVIGRHLNVNKGHVGIAMAEYVQEQLAS